jgi:integrase
MFDAIADDSDVIRAENRARREQEARCRWTLPGRPPATQVERLKAERAKLAAMPPYRKTNGAATRQAIRRTLRTALNAAISEQLITFNAAAHVELTAAPRPKGLLWTDERVARWRKTGEVPGSVMVWTPAQLGKFLDAAESHRLYAGYHLISHHGLRRGEGCGQGWDDTHLEAKPPRLDVLRELVVDGYTPIETAPKTDSSVAAVVIDRGTVAVLREHKKRQSTERKAWNAEAAKRRARGEDAHDWIETGKILTAEDGSWLHPDVLSREFVKLCEQADLPPINLRDLRHVAAALVKAGGGDIHDAKAKLRHANIALTSNTYMSLFEEYEVGLAERSAAAVPRATKGAPGTEATPEEADEADETVQDDEDGEAGDEEERAA